MTNEKPGISLYGTERGKHWHMDRWCSTVPVWHLTKDQVWPRTIVVLPSELQDVFPKWRCSRCFRLPVVA